MFQHDPLYPTECDKNGHINNVVTVGDKIEAIQETTEDKIQPSKEEPDYGVINKALKSPLTQQDESKTDEDTNVQCHESDKKAATGEKLETVKETPEISADLSSEYADDASLSVNKDSVAVPDNNHGANTTQEPKEKAELVSDGPNSLNIDRDSGQGNNFYKLMKCFL